MAVSKGTRLFKIASQINIGKDAIIEYLQGKGFEVENKPTAVLSDEMVTVVLDKFQKEVKAIEKQREKLEKHRKPGAKEPGYILTNLPNLKLTLDVYCCRWGIEQMFKDYKSGGDKARRYQGQ
jgi:chemotaxis response regulator CheB